MHDHRDFAPRVGFVYRSGAAVRHPWRQRTVLRAAVLEPLVQPAGVQRDDHRIVHAVQERHCARTGRCSSRTRRAARRADQFFAGTAAVPAQSPRIISPDYKNPYTWQSSIGFQKQLNSVTGDRGGPHALQRIPRRPQPRSQSVLRSGDRLQRQSLRRRGRRRPTRRSSTTRATATAIRRSSRRA